MTAELRLNKWGNSLAFRIPKPFIEKLELSLESKISINVEGEKLILQKQKSLKELCDKINEDNKHNDKLWLEHSTDKEW